MITNPFRLFRLAVVSEGINPYRIPLFMGYFLKLFCEFTCFIIENVFFRKKIKSCKIDSPIFILGHFRSGTTLLHKLLLTDKRFGYLSYSNVLFPGLFTISPKMTKYSGRLINRLKLKNYAFNHTVFDVGDPSEEDLMMASAGMSASTDWGFIFPQKAESLFSQSIIFNDHQSCKKWKEAYYYTLQRISYRNPGKQLLLKNPPNTGRVKALLELFPDARFIFIYRNPCHVFLSTQNLWKNVVKKATLQKLSSQRQNDIIFKYYELLTEKYILERSLIPERNLIELRYEDLKDDAYSCIEKIYRNFHIDGFESLGEDLKKRISKGNSYSVSPYNCKDEIFTEIVERLGRYISLWNYDYPNFKS